MEKTVISLNRAFKIRNLLKRELNELKSLYINAPKAINDQTTYRESRGLNTQTIVGKMIQIYFLLKELNIAITKASNETDILVTEINNAKDYQGFVKMIIRDLQHATYKEEKTNHVTGDVTVINYEPFDNINTFTGYEKGINKAIFTFEDSLAKLNAIENVDLTSFYNELKDVIPEI